MAMELKHLNPQHVMDVTGKAIDGISRLRAENAELKAKHVVDVYDEYSADPNNEAQVYIKSEADEVIAHQKYKRCLAMAKWCAKNVDHLNSEGYIYEKEGHANELDDCIKGTEFYHKWYERWLKLAEKFKETK